MPRLLDRFSGERQKPGASGCDRGDCRVEPIVLDGGADLKSSMRAARGPAHLSTLVHPGVEQGVHKAFGARRRDWLSLPPPPAGCPGSLGVLHPRSRTCRPCRHPDHGGHLQRHQWCTRGGRLDRRCDWRPFRYTGDGGASGGRPKNQYAFIDPRQIGLLTGNRCRCSTCTVTAQTKRAAPRGAAPCRPWRARPCSPSVPTCNGGRAIRGSECERDDPLPGMQNRADALWPWLARVHLSAGVHPC